MVFSNTGHRTRNILKVVELTDTVKVEKNLQVDPIGEALCSLAIPSATTSSATSGPAEVSYRSDFLKTEPVFESTMFHESDCEFFQDLDLWCSPDKEGQTKTIDVTEKVKERAYTTTTPITQYSPQGWEVIDASSPPARADVLPAGGDAAHYPYQPATPDTLGQEQFLDICKLPVVLGDIPSESTLNPWTHTYYTDTNTKPFIEQEDSLSYDPTECITWADYTFPDSSKDVDITELVVEPTSLRLDVTLPSLPTEVSTPDVLRELELLETERFPLVTPPDKKPVDVQLTLPTDIFVESLDDLSSAAPSVAEYQPITPKTESHLDTDDDRSTPPSRKRRKSSDSDDDYIPTPEKYTPRKYKRRKQHVPLQDMIDLLEGSAKTNTTRRGRPPKKRGEPTPDPSLSVQEVKYRELRDKNNEASKRSRQNRKLKELLMEKEADKLEKRNEKLRGRAKVLEGMTKRLKDALMSAVLKT